MHISLRHLSPRILLVGIIILSIFLHFFKLTTIRELVFDEVYFAKFGQDYLTFNECPQYMKEGGYFADKGCYDVHPPLGKLMIAAGESLFPLTNFREYEAQKSEYEAKKLRRPPEAVKDFHYEFTATNVLAWRLMPAIFGIFLVFLMYVLGTMLFESEWWGLFTAFLMLIDNYFLIQSRLSLIDIFMITFQIAALICFLKGFLKPADTMKNRFKGLGWYLFAGVFCGAALGVKFNGMAVLGVIIALIIYVAFIQLYNKISYRFLRLIRHSAVTVLVSSVCFFTFWGILNVPQLIFGHEFPWETDLEQKYLYHQGLTADHPYASEWYGWPLSINPVFYYYRVVVTEDIYGATSQLIYGINAHGNILMWWFGSFALVCLALYFVWNFFSSLLRRKKLTGYPVELIILVGFLASFLPWAFIGRVKFLYHFLPSVPFMFLAIVWLFKKFSESSYLEKNIRNWIMAFIVILFVLCFLFYLPMTIGLPFNNSAAYDMRWFRIN